VQFVLFYTVCYREASDEQYRQFCDDLETRTDLTDKTRQDITDVIRQLDDQKRDLPVEKPKVRLRGVFQKR
jgi:hypothetical protein